VVEETAVLFLSIRVLGSRRLSSAAPETETETERKDFKANTIAEANTMHKSMSLFIVRSHQ